MIDRVVNRNHTICDWDLRFAIGIYIMSGQFTAISKVRSADGHRHYEPFLLSTGFDITHSRQRNWVFYPYCGLQRRILSKNPVSGPRCVSPINKD